ncbi:MAG: DUF2284 domain-containing protein [Oscillospiraceae bacterium]
MKKPSNFTSLMDTVMASGAANVGIIEVSAIPFRREFRVACEQNACGKYGRCWMCPPDVGDIDKMIAQAKKYRYALVFQSIGQLEDSFDIEGMEAAAKEHNALMQRLAVQLAPLLGSFLKLGAGGCQVCPHCTRPDNQPCRHPDMAMASLEAYGIAVSELAELSGMKYINGSNTVTYFGGFLF